MENTCGCGCGTPVAPRYVHGHNPKSAGIPRADVPRVKICEECGEAYTRESVTRQSNKHWLVRRFCSEPCRRAWRAAASAAQRGSIRKVDATDAAGHKRARTLYPGPNSCDECGKPAEIHHKDGDPLNNDRENIAFLCRLHHIRAEDRMAYRRLGPETPEQGERRRANARERQRRYRERQRETAEG